MTIPGKSPTRARLIALAFTAVLAAGVVASPPARSDPTSPVPIGTAWGSGTLTEDELGALVLQMTLQEKVAQLHGSSDSGCSTTPLGCWGQAGWIPGVARLGIPPLRLTDGPAGVRLGHVETSMPAPVGLTATFDRNAAALFGKSVGAAGRASNQDVWLAPMMNAVNYVTGGRNFETLGEDPYLAAELAAELTKGVQGEGLIAQIKHYITNDFENGRNSTSVKVDEQTLHENSLQAFEAGVKAGAGSVMCSYNRINDVYGCGNDYTLNQVLRSELGFKGFVTSDWGATHRTTDLINGLDMEQSGSSNFGTPLITAAINGTPEVPMTNDYPAQPAFSAGVWMAAIDASVLRILRAMNSAGLLEGTQNGSRYTDGTPYVPTRPDLASLRDADFQTAQALAEESATLLKNEGKALPLTSADLAGAGTVVMGPTAIAPYTGGGGSAHVIPYDTAPSPYASLLDKAPGGSKLSYVPGYDMDGKLVPSSVLTAPDPAEGYPNWTLTPADAAFAGQPGLLRQQITTAAVPSGSQPVLQTDGAPDQLDSTVDYTAATLPAGTGWRWTGTLTAPANPGGTTWQLKVFVRNQASSQLFTEGLSSSGGGSNRRINLSGYPAAPTNSLPSQSQTAKSHDPAHPDLQQATYTVALTAGQKVHLDLRLVAGASPAQIQFRWVPPDNQAASIAQAVAAAKAAKKAVIFAYDEGTEGSDRGGSNQAAGMVLPGYQEALIAAVAAAQPNTVVVLNNGAPVLMPWAGAVKSILQMWYPGQAGGPATANVLLGAANPGGKLPVTFPANGTAFPTYDPSCTDTSSAGNCPIYPGVARIGFLGTAPHSYREITGLDMTSGNGIFQGYRWYDKHGVKPLFPFGHGLSYTTFAYSNLAVTPRSDGTVDVAFVVKNTGDVRGDEVPQVYVGPGPAIAGVQQAAKSLRGFRRIALSPGESRTVEITLAPRSFEYWSTAEHAWVTNPGHRTVWVGASSTDLRLSSTAADVQAAGVVPATLALTTGPAATFGVFTPAVTRDYFASTTATVTSTAGEAVLSVADATGNATGRLVNGTFALPQALQARARNAQNTGTAYNFVGTPVAALNLLSYSGPVSADPVTLEFKQSIAATDALRTGTYGKTLTFSLSTTTP
jgi:beta-glucosidase